MTVFAAGLSGLMAITFCASGMDLLKHRIRPEKRAAYFSAVHYQLLHSVAALSASLALRSQGTCDALGSKGVQRLRLAKNMWLCGSVVFSGSIYALVLMGLDGHGDVDGDHQVTDGSQEAVAAVAAADYRSVIRTVLRPLTPLGGTTMGFGWLALALV